MNTHVFADIADDPGVIDPFDGERFIEMQEIEQRQETRNPTENLPNLVLIPGEWSNGWFDYRRLPDTSGGGFFLGIRHPVELGLEPHPFQLPVEGLSFDADDLGGAALVAAGGGEHFADLVRLGVSQSFASAL